MLVISQPSLLPASPEIPSSFGVSPKPSGFHITLKNSVLDGGSPITHYIVQWKKELKDNWNESAIPVSGNFLHFHIIASTLYKT